MRRLLVDSDLLRTSYEIDRGHYRLRLTLPSAPTEEEDDDPTLAELAGRFPELDEFPLVARGLHSSTTVSMRGIPWITTLRVEGFFDGDVSADDFSEETNDTSALDAALDALHAAEHAARETVGRLLESIRLRGQHWLGPDAGSPRGIAQSRIDDLDAGRRLPVSSRSESTLVLRRIQRTPGARRGASRRRAPDRARRHTPPCWRTSSGRTRCSCSRTRTRPTLRGR
jgi:hypothetical protein